MYEPFMAPRCHSPKTFPSAFPGFNSHDHLEKQNRTLTASGSTSAVAVGRALARCAGCSTGVLSAQESSRAAYTSVASGLGNHQQGCYPSQGGTGTLWSKGNAHQFQHKLDLLLFNYFFVFNSILTRAMRGDH